MDEAKLIEKLQLIEALFSGATTDGERIAAERARERILEKLKQLEREDPPVEIRFTMSDMWTRKVFVALLRRYGIQPYRYRGQRYTTVVAKMSKRFVDEALWPEFQAIADTLDDYLAEVTDRVVHQVIHRDSSEAEVVETTRQLSFGLEEGGSAVTPTAPPATPSSGERPSSSGKRGAGSTVRNRAKQQRKKKRKRR